MAARKKERLGVKIVGKFAVVSLVDMEIWDGADLALLREALTALIERDGYRAIGVDLSSVKYIPSGFYGMLGLWYDSGIQIRLYNPQEIVESMSWFRMFFVCQADGSYLHTDQRMRNNTPNEQIKFHRKKFNPDEPEDSNGVRSNSGFVARAGSEFANRLKKNKEKHEKALKKRRQPPDPNG